MTVTSIRSTIGARVCDAQVAVSPERPPTPEELAEILAGQTAEGLAKDARLQLAGRSADASECKRLGLMLGLFEIDQNGNTVATGTPQSKSR